MSVIKELAPYFKDFLIVLLPAFIITFVACLENKKEVSTIRLFLAKMLNGALTCLIVYLLIVESTLYSEKTKMSILLIVSTMSELILGSLKKICKDVVINTAKTLTKVRVTTISEDGSEEEEVMVPYKKPTKKRNSSK